MVKVHFESLRGMVITKICYCVQVLYVLMCARAALAGHTDVSEKISVVPSAVLVQFFNLEKAL